MPILALVAKIPMDAAKMQKGSLLVWHSITNYWMLLVKIWASGWYLIISVTTTWFWLPNNCLWIPMVASPRSTLVFRVLCEFTLPRSWLNSDWIGGWWFFAPLDFPYYIQWHKLRFTISWIMNRWLHDCNDTWNPQKNRSVIDCRNQWKSDIAYIYLSIRPSVHLGGQ